MEQRAQIRDKTKAWILAEPTEEKKKSSNKVNDHNVCVYLTKLNFRESRKIWAIL